MTGRLQLLIILLACGIHSKVLGQKSENDNLYFDFKDGLYLNIEEFKLNHPSIPLDLTAVGELGNGDVIRSKQFKYKEKDSILVISAKEVLFVCLKGTIYINHKYATQSKYPNTYTRFYKIHRVGYFCNYFLHNYSDKGFKTLKKAEIFTHVFVPAFNLNVYGLRSAAPDQEYILSLKDNRIYNVRKSSKKLKLLIKEDKYFVNTKIRNKDLIIYLGQYNKRHVFRFGEG